MSRYTAFWGVHFHFLYKTNSWGKCGSLAFPLYFKIMLNFLVLNIIIKRSMVKTLKECFFFYLIAFFFMVSIQIIKTNTGQANTAHNLATMAVIYPFPSPKWLNLCHKMCNSSGAVHNIGNLIDNHCKP